MAGAREATALDHLIFAGGSAAIRDVMVAGRWVVKDRRHAAEERLAGRFKELMAAAGAERADHRLPAQVDCVQDSAGCAHGGPAIGSRLTVPVYTGYVSSP